MWERKIEAPGWERSLSCRRRRGVGNFLGLGRGWGRGDVVVDVVDVGGGSFGADDVGGGGFDDMAGDIAGWK